ncbi:hypothetical protein TSUD_262060 [Trifolium subterraneum]|nr:hypothetical protein TSUD_262060 [Trifolium subterraneum]
MGKLISEVQSAFLPNRQILDGVLIVNELIDLAKRRKDKCLFFKVDFEPAYDTVNWNFLDYMLTRMGFAEGWRRWIRACVFQSSMSVLINGSITEDFNVGKELRQGDPLSHFLFLIAAEGLTGLMRSAVDKSLFHGYTVEWTEPLTESEAAADAELQLLLEQVQPCRDGEDRRKWIPNTVGVFSVKSVYTVLQNGLVMTEFDSNTLSALKRLWKNNVPSKISIFGWRLLLDKLPTRETLFSKGILNNTNVRNCVLCSREIEDIQHLFFHCQCLITLSLSENFVKAALAIEFAI